MYLKWCQSFEPFDSFPRLLNVWPPKHPQMPTCVSWGNLFGVYPFPDEYAHVYQILWQSVQPFHIFPWLLNLWPPANVEGQIVFSLCPFPDESADMYEIWCKSVKPFDSLPRLFDLWPPKTTQNATLCLQVQFVWHISIPRLICTCVPNLVLTIRPWSFILEIAPFPTLATALNQIQLCIWVFL